MSRVPPTGSCFIAAAIHECLPRDTGSRSLACSGVSVFIFDSLLFFFGLMTALFNHQYDKGNVMMHLKTLITQVF